MQKEETLNALYFEMGKEPYWIQVENTLSAKQKLVEGYIEFVDLAAFGGPEADAVINEEGKFTYGPNRVLGEGTAYADYIAGPFFVVGPCDENGYSTSLSKETAEEVKNFFRTQILTF